MYLTPFFYLIAFWILFTGITSISVYYTVDLLLRRRQQISGQATSILNLNYRRVEEGTIEEHIPLRGYSPIMTSEGETARVIDRIFFLQNKISHYLLKLF